MTVARHRPADVSTRRNDFEATGAGSTVTEDETETDPACPCKVGRGIAAFGLTAMNDDLVAGWQGTADGRESVRELTERYNRRLLEAAFGEAEQSPLSGEVANVYRLLTEEDVSSGVRTQTRRRLEGDDVPVTDVEDAFVSHQTMHTHLTDCLDASREPSRTDPETRRHRDRDRIRALQNRTEVVTADALDRLATADSLALEGFDVLVDVTVLCRECGAQHEVGSLLDAGGCSCASTGAE
jgi:hypothetical protein